MKTDLFDEAVAPGLGDASFDAVVSNSTLDHFERRMYLQRAVAGWRG